jgi:AmmeMemoRadiSam system protein B
MIMTDHPRLRPVEPIPIEVEGEQLIALRDPRALSERTMLVSPATFILARLFDGRSTAEEVARQFADASGVHPSPAAVRDLLEQLDATYLLDNQRAGRRMAQLEAAWRRQDVRPPARHGKAYPADVDDLRRLFDECLALAAGEDPSEEDDALDSTGPRAVLAPHVAYERAKRCYGHSYRRIARWRRPVTVVVFGTGHGGVVGGVSATRQHYDTPLGRVETDQAFLERLAELSPIGIGRDERSHQTEHSVEFQAIFLQHVLGESVDYRIVPILVGSFQDYVEAGRRPTQDDELAGYVKALRATIESHDRPVCLLGAVDLAHLGPRYGDDFAIDTERLSELRRRDVATLGSVLAGRATDFFDSIARENDDRRWCGFPPIYLLLWTLLGRDGSPGLQGDLLAYDQSVDETGSVVTACSAVLA